MRPKYKIWATMFLGVAKVLAIANNEALQVLVQGATMLMVIMSIATYLVLPEIPVAIDPQDGNGCTSNENECNNILYYLASKAWQYVEPSIATFDVRLLQVKPSIATLNI